MADEFHKLPCGSLFQILFLNSFERLFFRQVLMSFSKVACSRIQSYPVARTKRLLKISSGERSYINGINVKVFAEDNRRYLSVKSMSIFFNSSHIVP